MEKKTICYVDISKWNDSIIHTLQTAHGLNNSFSEVIKWFNDENATSLVNVYNVWQKSKSKKCRTISSQESQLHLFAKYYLHTHYFF